MQKQSSSGSDEEEQPTFTMVQDQVGISRGTLKKYLAFLGIEPVCFHIGTRRLYISRDDLERVKRLKRDPSILANLMSAVIPSHKVDEARNL